VTVTFMKCTKFFFDGRGSAPYAGLGASAHSLVGWDLGQGEVAGRMFATDLRSATDSKGLTVTRKLCHERSLETRK